MTDLIIPPAGRDGDIAIPFRRWKNHPSTGVDFPDLSPATVEAATARQIIEALAPRLPAEVEVLAGVDIGGLGLAAALAYRNGLGFLDVRKVDSIRIDVMRSVMANYDLGNGVAISKGNRLAGRKVAVIDDCLMSGGTALAAVQLIRRLGGLCQTALFVFDLAGMGGRERLAAEGVTAQTLRTLSRIEADAQATRAE